MKNAADSVSEHVEQVNAELELLKLSEELLERRSRPSSYLSTSDMPIIESPRKYGRTEDLTDEEAEEIGRRLWGKRRREKTQDDAKRGAEIGQYYEELKRISLTAKGKRHYPEAEIRNDFPEFKLWKALDNSTLSQKLRQEFFTNPQLHNRERRFSFIGELMGVSASTAYDLYKGRPGVKKRQPHSK